MTTDRCIDDDELAAFFAVDGALSERERARVQAHIDRCSPCRHLVAEVARTNEDERVVIRDGKVRRAKTDSSKTAAVVVAGRFRLERILGEGGAGIVWEATHTVMHRRVALKMLKSASPEAAHRFFREARVTSALRHPNIVEVHDCFLDPESGKPVMVMEYLEGHTLAAFLRGPGAARRALDLRATALTLLPVIAALGAAHDVGVVHRDLKPENVFIGRDVVKVVDFGIAKLTARDGAVAKTADLTRKGAVLGTVHYMAPEQIDPNGDVDARTDLWALGVMMYECLAGVRPIEASTARDAFSAIRRASFVSLSERVPSVSNDIAMLTMDLLSKEKRERPTLADVHRALVRYA